MSQCSKPPISRKPGKKCFRKSVNEAERDADGEKRRAGEETGESSADGAGHETRDRAALALPLQGAQQGKNSGDDESDERIAGGILAERLARDESVNADDGDEDAEADEKGVEKGFCGGLLARGCHDPAVEQGVALRAFPVDRARDKLVAVGGNPHGVMIALLPRERPCLRV
jgi:hypothetical protein